LSVTHIMEFYGDHPGSTGKSREVHREVQIKHDLMTRECKYTLMA